MSIRKVSLVSLFISIFVLGSVAVFAQTGSVSGMVWKKGPEGEKIPIEGVRLDCYRTDIQQSCRTIMTNKDGEFTFLGLPFSAKVIMGVSGPGIAPTVVPEIAPGEKGSDKLSVEVTEGDGSVPTETDVRDVASRQFTGELSEDQKKKQEEIEKERQAILDRNKKVEERNEQRMALLKAGEAAFNSKDYKTAALKFQEGYELDPEFIGSAPTFLNNVALSKKSEAVMVYNEAVKAKQASQVRPIVAELFTSCLTSTLKAYGLATNAKPESIIDPVKHKASIKASEDIVKDSFRILGQLKLNLAGYVGTEEEAAASVDLYKSSLGILPDNPDVLAGLTFALYTSSALTGNEAEKQQSLNYGTVYLDKADKAHALREAVTEIVDLIKTEGLKPQPVK